MSHESGLNYRTITVEKYDALLAVTYAERQSWEYGGVWWEWIESERLDLLLDVVEAAKIHVAARYCKIDALRDALDALDAAP